MAGYIGANTSSVTNNQNAAERRKKFTFTANTTSLTGLNFAPAKIHIFHNGIRLVKDTDFTEASDGKSVTLTNAAQAGDEVVAVTFAQDPASNTDFVSASTGGTFSGDVDMASGTTFDASAGLTTPAGHIIQVVTNTVTSVVSQSSTSWTTMFSATITPKFNTSKIFIQAMVGGLYMNLSGANQSSWRICRNSGTSITDANTHFHTEVGRNLTSAGTRAFPNMSIVDSPATTSATTYNVQSERHTGSGGIQINDTSGTSTITLMEIAQ